MIGLEGDDDGGGDGKGGDGKGDGGSRRGGGRGTMIGKSALLPVSAGGSRGSATEREEASVCLAVVVVVVVVVVTDRCRRVTGWFVRRVCADGEGGAVQS